MLLRAQSLSSSQSSSKLLWAHPPPSLHKLSTAPSPDDPAICFCSTPFLNLSSGLERDLSILLTHSRVHLFVGSTFPFLPHRLPSVQPPWRPSTLLSLSLLKGPVPLLPARLDTSLSKARADVIRRQADVPVRRACPGPSVLGYPESQCLSLAWAVRLGDATPRLSVQCEPHFPPPPATPEITE